ncbi:hypothetical protein AYL99_10336 [Fonsecaea erecta]|uniref:Type 1 phosphatases regulator n=1 Tax=Fonsecaea erecta TaxID=1367422 RepID=A0A178Z854_9EURO|nr:hypothetical protein AYL99_10336 [Fonsecaea erecta]OAP55363.1 hypothetical protein AYL99_10336 [Fonsecaea erecta]
MSSSTAPSIQPPAMNSSHNPSRPAGARHLAPALHAASPARRATSGSATQTVTPVDSASSRSASPEPLILRLRGAHDAALAGSSTNTSRGRRRQITWAEDVVDNEGLGRKSSKVCCIYHKPREFGESSSEDDSSSDSSSDSDSDAGGSDSPDDGGARMSGNRRGRKHDHRHGHPHDHDHDDGCDHGKGKGRRKPSPNAYERMPRYQTKHDTKKR